jgi:aryl-alcohol dehydrogenase-like predicted oxidoreductase
MQYRTLGKTGERVSAIGLGGAHVARPQDPAETTRLIHAAIDGGITFMDNCWDYHAGQAEVKMGHALRDGYRERVFLMTKIDGHTREAAAGQIEQCLERLQTEMIDLIQLHEMIRPDDPERVFAPNGAMEALIAAREAGKIRYIGFTGHKDPAIHRKMLEQGFDFDTVQMPLNVMDAHFRSFEKLVLPELVKQQIGVLGMKSMGSGVILKSQTVSAIDCLHYALNLPTSVVITGIDSMEILDQAFEAARTFQPMTAAAVAALLAKTAGAASEGKYELFKTSSVFDSTAQHPEWLGGQVPQAAELAPK